jgi:hypothetical protein
VDEASEGFFTTIGTPLLRGRFFSVQDGPCAPVVAIINEAMARRVWPGRNVDAADPLTFTAVAVADRCGRGRVLLPSATRDERRADRGA